MCTLVGFYVKYFRLLAPNGLWNLAVMSRNTLWSVGGSEWYRHGKNEVLGEKSVPVPHCTTYIPHILAWDRNRAYSVSGWQLTAPSENQLCPSYTWALDTACCPSHVINWMSGRHLSSVTRNLMFTSCQFLSAFAKLQKVTIRFHMSVFLSASLPACLSVPPHGTARLPLERYSWNVMFEWPCIFD
jgi:hypothetical protein